MLYAKVRRGLLTITFVQKQFPCFFLSNLVQQEPQVTQYRCLGSRDILADTVCNHLYIFSIPSLAGPWWIWYTYILVTFLLTSINLQFTWEMACFIIEWILLTGIHIIIFDVIEYIESICIVKFRMANSCLHAKNQIKMWKWKFHKRSKLINY